VTPVDNNARVQAATDLDTTLFVEAAAGTGKTTALVSRILSAIKTGRARLYEVVAITFTEKAAGDLKIRLREELEKQLTGDALRRALSDLERAPIMTIHSFCASLLRERPVEAAVDPQFTVADDLQRRLLLDKAWATWLEQELAQNPPALRHALFREVRLDALQDLATLLVEHRGLAPTWPAHRPLDTRAAVKQLTGCVASLERCLKHCVVKSGNLFAHAQTFGDTLPQLADAAEERVVAVLTNLTLAEPRRIADFDSAEAFREAKELIKELKAKLAEFATVADHNFLVELVTWLHGFVGHFQQLKQQQSVLDFDDLLEKTRDLFRAHPAVVADCRQRYRFLLVDEFQDTDPVQMEIVLALGGDTPGKLFIVGDPKQSIYGFRRADIEMYAGTRRTLAKTGRVLQFQQNFRSQSTILDWVNAVFAKLIQRPTDGDYQPDYIPLKPTHLTTEPRVTLLQPPALPAKQSVEEARRAEAAAIAGYLHRQVAAGACQWGDVAMLFRSFTGLDVYEEVFVEHGVPFRIVGGRGYYQRQEIQTLIALLCCLDNPNDQLHLVATLRSPLFGWTDEQVFLAAAADKLNYLHNADLALLRELHEQRHTLSVAGFVERVLAKTHLCQAMVAGGPNGGASVANLLKALALARQLEAAGIRSLRGLVRQLRRTVVGGADEEPAPANEEDEAVQLLTMHKAKGLEFKVVVLADLAGKSSDSGARLLVHRATGTHELRFAGSRTGDFDAAATEQDKRDEAEEIRLLYVAATRARERLVIPLFAEKGERLDLLKRGMDGAPGATVEVENGGARFCVPASEERTRGSASLRTARQSWQQDRAALLARAAQPVARVSPSKLGGEAEPREDEPTGAVREQAIELGVAVHAALERMEATGLAGQARQLVERALQSELFRRAAKADAVYRELPFATTTMDGKIDLLFREGDRWTLVDYKTDAVPAPEKYREQMAAYRAALQQTAGIAVAETLLYFVATDEVVPLP
jgi:ATP-dependent exoDNAse (exonuclease V) beta subunit